MELICALEEPFFCALAGKDLGGKSPQKVFRDFVELSCSILSKVCNDLCDLRRIVRRIFPKYLEPLDALDEEDRLDPGDLTAMYRFDPPFPPKTSKDEN